MKDQKERIAAIQKENKDKMQSFLTADQKAQIEKDKAEGKKKFEARTKERSDKMKTHLGLNDAQSAQLKKNREATQQKIKFIKEDSKMSEEQKKEQIKELMKAQKESMKSVLTEEQMKKMKESKHRKPGSRDADRKRPVKNDTI